MKKLDEQLIISTEEEDDYEDEQEVEGGWDDWNADESEDGDSDFKCLFCESNFSNSTSLFEHCDSYHRFDFVGMRKSLGLDFYGCFKLVNYIRRMVAENTCWCCGHQCKSNAELQNHLHEPSVSKELKNLWDDEKYLQPFMQGDSLLYSFDQDDDFEDECVPSIDQDELMKIRAEAGEICVNADLILGTNASTTIKSNGKGVIEEDLTSDSSLLLVGDSSLKTVVNGNDVRPDSEKKKTNAPLRVPFANIAAASEIRKVNESYFGSYSSFGIHREMLSDKAGASRVIGVDASAKMASVATQVAKDNGLLRIASNGDRQCTGVVEIVHGMVEDLEKSLQIEPHSVDVLLSEWMGYCLLYESMLGSVLYARDRWLKPGGAILPDTATMFAAGFGRGGTSLPFWENVYGFDMSSVGKELVQDAAEIPIVDVIDSHDIVTDTAVLQTFDLATMRLDDMDFTSCIELHPKSDCNTEPTNTNTKTSHTWCHGLILWFDTGFTSRFCMESPANLSTSPHTLKTHWSQTLLTFKEPIALSSEKPNLQSADVAGAKSSPASKIHLRISIARASQHRSIDISIEPSGVGHDGHKRVWPAQIFNLS